MKDSDTLLIAAVSLYLLLWFGFCFVWGTGFHAVSQIGSDLKAILLSQLLGCWDMGWILHVSLKVFTEGLAPRSKLLWVGGLLKRCVCLGGSEDFGRRFGDPVSSSISL